MSLLMEALRKAEEAKRRMQQEEQAAANARESTVAADSTPSTGFTLEEREPDLTPEYIRDNFTSRGNHSGPSESPHDSVVDKPAPAADPEPAHASRSALTPSLPAAARRQQRAAAASVFHAKQNPARNRKTLTILVVVMVLMIPVGGGVLWYLQSATTSSIGINPALANYDLSSRSLSDAAPSPAEPPQNAAPSVTPDTRVAAAEQSLVAEPPPATSPTVEAPPPAVAESAVETTVEVPPPAQQQTPVQEVATAPSAPAPALPPPNAAQVPMTQAETPVIAANSVLEISRSRSSSQVNPDLVIAYESLQSGDLATARRLYEQLLAVSPNNRDALLGLASIDLRGGNAARARGLYARLLQLNPRDPLAHTGLLQTMQASNPAEHERTLKSLISQYPDVPQLTLALGNHYAAQQRWSEAQSAYYNALLAASRGTSGPVHPDYAFNLAVSLEQLGEPAAALDYYRRAKTLSADVTPGFDPQLLNSRLDYLSTQAQP